MEKKNRSLLVWGFSFTFGIRVLFLFSCFFRAEVGVGGWRVGGAMGLQAPQPGRCAPHLLQSPKCPCWVVQTLGPLPAWGAWHGAMPPYQGTRRLGSNVGYNTGGVSASSLALTLDPLLSSAIKRELNQGGGKTWGRRHQCVSLSLNKQPSMLRLAVEILG